ncbi:MAG: DUF2791 family P-loop domain-containing protein [Planctomycetota bacterium]
MRLDGDPGLPWTLPLGELRIERPEPEPQPVAPALPPRPAPVGVDLGDIEIGAWPLVTPAANGSERADLRQTVEAMRLGVVPAEHVREYTVGREATFASLEEILGVQGGLRVLWGDYGSGKTHMLDIAERIALEHGYLTSRIVLDPFEVPPSHPRRLYASIVERLRYPDDQGHGLEPLFERLVESDEHADPGGHFQSRFYSPYLFALRREDGELLDWMRDYVDGCNMDVADGNARLARLGWAGPRLLTMSDYRTYGRMYTHLLGTMATWAKDAGYRGLLLLFDEVEFVDSLSKQELGFAMEVLKHFAAVTVPREDLCFDPDALYKGGHKVHRELRLHFRSDQPLTVLFALTPLADIQQSFRGIVDKDEWNIPLPPLRESDLGDLLRGVLGVYLRAYPDSGIVPDDRAEVLSVVRDAALDRGTSPRVLVRSLATALDAIRWRRRTWETPS